MEETLDRLKKEFSAIKVSRDNVINLFSELENRIIKLKSIYKEFIECNKGNLFIFGLDSFQFQSKLIDIEYNDLKRLFFVINNKIYCEYYKLHKIISHFMKDNVPDKKVFELIKLSNEFPIYKDLEPFKQYDFDIIQDIHENLLLLLFEINAFIEHKENELLLYKKKQDNGLNINNFVMTFKYNILTLKEKMDLFISYIDFFHNLHTKYLQRFAMKVNLMYSQVTHDISFEDTIINIDEKKKELISNLKKDINDKKFIKELKKTIDDESGSIDSDLSSVSKYKQNFISINTGMNENNENTDLTQECEMSPFIFNNNVEAIVFEVNADYEQPTIEEQLTNRVEQEPITKESSFKPIENVELVNKDITVLSNAKKKKKKRK